MEYNPLVFYHLSILKMEHIQSTCYSTCHHRKQDCILGIPKLNFSIVSNSIVNRCFLYCFLLDLESLDAPENRYQTSRLYRCTKCTVLLDL